MSIINKLFVGLFVWLLATQVSLAADTTPAVTAIGTNTTTTGTTISITLTGTAPAGSTIVLIIADNAGTLSSISDSNGNSYFTATSQNFSSSGETSLNYCFNCTLSSGQTITYTGSTSGAKAATLAYVSNLWTLETPKQPGGSIGTSDTGTSVSWGTTNISTQYHAMIIGAVGVKGTSADTFTQDATYTTNITRAGNSTITINAGSKLNTIGTGLDYTPTLGTSRDWASVGVIFFHKPVTITTTSIGTNTVTAGNTVSVTVPSGGVPAGSLIVVNTADSSTATTLQNVTDSASNTYTKVGFTANNNNSANGFSTLFYAYNVTALSSGNTITFTLGQTSKNAAITAYYATGVQSGLDPIDGTNSNFGSSTSPQSFTANPSTEGELLTGFVTTAGTSADSFTQATPNWTTPPVRVGIAGTGGPTVAGGSFQQSGTVDTSPDYTPTLGTSRPWAAWIAGFIASDIEYVPPTPGAAGGGLLTLGVGQ